MDEAASVNVERRKAESRGRGTPGLIEDAYHEHARRFERLAASIVGRDAAGDVVQDAFARALAGAARWRGDGNIDAWLWRLVLNAAYDVERRRTRSERLVSRLTRFLPSGSVVDAPRDDVLLAPLRSLSIRQRECVVLRYYGDLAYEDIAAVLGIEQGTVAALLSRAHAALRVALTQEDQRDAGV